MDPQSSIILNGLNYSASFLDISRYLTDKFLDIVWGYPPPKNSQTSGPNATNILINLLPIVIFCKQRVIFSIFWHFLSQFARVNQGRT